MHRTSGHSHLFDLVELHVFPATVSQPTMGVFLVPKRSGADPTHDVADEDRAQWEMDFYLDLEASWDEALKYAFREYGLEPTYAEDGTPEPVADDTASPWERYILVPALLAA